MVIPSALIRLLQGLTVDCAVANWDTYEAVESLLTSEVSLYRDYIMEPSAFTGIRSDILVIKECNEPYIAKVVVMERNPDPTNCNCTCKYKQHEMDTRVPSLDNMCICVVNL